MNRVGSTVLIAAALAAGAAGCGGDDESQTTTDPASSTTTSSTTVAGQPQASADEPAKLPKGWSEEVNRKGGFSIGVPPDWSVESTEGGQGTVFVSPDELITMTVTPDRTQGALELPLDEFATRTAEALGSEVVGDARIEKLKVGEDAPFDHTYEAVGVRGVGRSSETGVLELILVVVARRADQAAFVFVARQNAEKESSLSDRDELKRIIRSTRDIGTG